MNKYYSKMGVGELWSDLASHQNWSVNERNFLQRNDTKRI